MDVKEKLNELKAKAADKAREIGNDAKRFYYDHEREVWYWGPRIVAGTIIVANTVAKTNRKHKEDDRKDCGFYDPRKGTWYYSKRPLSEVEKLELDRLYDTGLSKGEALREMGLLRY